MPKSNASKQDDPEPRRSRRKTGSAAVNYKETNTSSNNSNNKSNNEDDDGDAMETDPTTPTDEDETEIKPNRRSSRRGQGQEVAPPPSRRTSSRANKCTRSLAEPSKSIRDLVGAGGGFLRTNNNTKKKRATSKAKDEDDDDEDDDQAPSRSPYKSPARRHAQRRRSLRPTELSSTDDEDDASSAEDDDEDEEPLKIQRILASRTEKRKTWTEICQKLNTSEIDYGSRWFQEPNDNDDGEVFEERFLIKWSDLSYLHSSWETQEDLIEQIEGAKLYLSTFFRKSVGGLLFSADERCDGDYFDPGYTEIDRILEITWPDDDDERLPEDEYDRTSFGMVLDKSDPEFENGTGRQFLIKWRNLPYAEATYEFERDLVLREVEYKQAVRDFRSRNTKTENRTQLLRKGIAEQKRLQKVFDDDEKIEEYKNELQSVVYKNGGQLRDYQAEGVAWMVSNYVNHRSSILADEMGLGKTLQTAVLANILVKELHCAGPVLVIVPLSTMAHWYREFASWTDLNVVVYHGSAQDREIIRHYEMVYECDRPEGGVSFNQLYLKKCLQRKRGKGSPWMIDVLITTPEMIVTDDFLELTAILWELLVVDEAHRLKNHNSKLAVNLRDERFSFKHKLLLTGTPIQNSVEEFWSLLNIMDESKFSSLEEFMESYGDMKTKESVDQLHEEIRPYILRRLKEDVEKSVPQKEGTLIEVELTVHQKQWYRALYEKNLKFLHKNKKKPLDGPGLNNLAMELRKCCNHLFLLKGVEDEFRREHRGMSEGDFLVKASGKLVLLDKLLPRLKEEGHRILIFSQFKIMLDILEDYLHARSFLFERIDGSITGNRRQQAIDRFQAQPTEGKELPFIMMLSTRAGGVGINLTAADTVIIFDSDFNPQNDLQAQARCHRIGQTKSVNVYRLLTRKTYEMQMFHMSSLKMGLDQAVLKGFENSSTTEGALTKEEVERLLRHGAYDIFNEDKAGASEAASREFCEQDIDSILARRSRTVVHENTGTGSGAAGGTFSKARFMAADPDKVKAERENIDIEDPDFWKKMIGEPNPLQDDGLLGPRQRTKKNYSEREYHRQLEETLRGDASQADSDSDSSLEEDVEETLGHERSRWGGSLPTEWKREDAENLIKGLTAYGYGLKNWEEVMGLVPLVKKYDLMEFKRMSWSLVLTTIVETALEEVQGAKKREEKAAKLKEETFEKGLEAGGILAVVDRPHEDEGIPVNPKTAEEAFQRIWKTVSEWACQALVDAVEFAKDHDPRDKDTIENLFQGKVEKLTADAVSSKFAESVWPSLKGRGWTATVVNEGDLEGKTRYSYKDLELFSIEGVLQAAKTFHSELSSVLDTLLLSIETNRRETELSNTLERSKHVNLSVENVDLDTVVNFLERYGPLQLVCDRRKGVRLRLGKRLLSTCTLLHTAWKLLKRVGNKDDGTVDLDKLHAAIAVDKRFALPHPMWTSRHDAILIHAIAKHGWIDHDASCRAITDDKTITWGAPFDTSAVADATENSQASSMLLATAERALNFLNKFHNVLEEIKGLNTFLLAKTYGLVQNSEESSQSQRKWALDRGKLEHSSHGNQSLTELPTKKELVKRAKIILSRTASSDGTVQEKTKECPNYGFAIIDQSERCNILLAEILRAILKTAVSSKSLKDLCNAAVEEARLRANISTSNQPGEKTESQRIFEQVQLVKNSISTGVKQCKNLLRVMLGEEPVKNKNPSDALFPKPRTVLSTTGSKPSVKTNVPNLNIVKSTGETAIANARKKMNDIYGNPQKLSTLGDDTSLLELTEIETLILLVLCTYGIPTWDSNVLEFMNVADLNANEIKNTLITWGTLGKSLAQCARDELERLRTKLTEASEKKSKIKENVKGGGGSQRNLITIVADLENAVRKSESVVNQADEYAAEPESLAKKAVMLMAKVRQLWGAMQVSAFTGRAHHGLGTKTIVWLDREVSSWARSLELLDDTGKPLGFTAVDFIEDIPDDERMKIQIACILDKKSSRHVIGQIAMLTRIRGIYRTCRNQEFDHKVEKAVKNILDSGDTWENEPHWWLTPSQKLGHQVSYHNDKVLLERLMSNGLTDKLLELMSSNIRDEHMSSPFSLSKLDLQRRANQLTRELHLIIESEERNRTLKMAVNLLDVEESHPATGANNQDDEVQVVTSVHRGGHEPSIEKEGQSQKTVTVVDMISKERPTLYEDVVFVGVASSPDKRKQTELSVNDMSKKQRTH